MRTQSEKIALAVGLLCAVIAAALAEAVVPQFRGVFEGFQTELPTATMLVVNYYRALWLLPLAVLGIWYSRPKSKNGALSACLTGVVSLAVLLPVLLYTLYLPVSIAAKSM